MQRNLVVCKFGGSSMADAGQFKKIEAIVRSDAARKVVVVSAPGKRNSTETKLTDLLYTVYHLASNGLDFSSPYGLVRQRFMEIAADLGLKVDFAKELDAVEASLKQDPSQITVDFVVSRGEYLGARMMAEYLGATFVDGPDLIEIDARQRVVNSSYEKISAKLSGDSLYVVPGFYGVDKHGHVKTFSRGGSDITGAILAKGLGADIYENWTDVSGLLMADPRIVDGPQPMPYVSYREIRELAYSGANVLHDEAIAPCKELSIPINIRNTNKAEDQGTIIGPEPESCEHIITGVAGRKGFSLIHIEKNMMNKERGFGRKVLGILEGYNLSYEHAPTGIDSMSIVVESASLEDVRDLVLEDIRKQLEVDNIKVEDDLALIATVGHGMVRQVGVAARLFSALAQNGVNIRIIDQGSSEINIIAGVDSHDYEKAIRSIYQAFVEVL